MQQLAAAGKGLEAETTQMLRKWFKEADVEDSARRFGSSDGALSCKQVRWQRIHSPWHGHYHDVMIFVHAHLWPWSGTVERHAHAMLLNAAAIRHDHAMLLNATAIRHDHDNSPWP